MGLEKLWKGRGEVVRSAVGGKWPGAEGMGTYNLYWALFGTS